LLQASCNYGTLLPCRKLELLLAVIFKVFGSVLLLTCQTAVAVCYLQLYGSLVGMFELNNLALAVPAPVARYKDLLLHPTEYSVDVDEAAAALQEVQPLLEALGDDADAPAEVRLCMQ
jgi:hypothetical protein